VERTYNPLNVDELGRNAARALMQYSAVPLPPVETFSGAGVYTIHYGGDFGPYSDMGDGEPIYVGKADAPGKRQGRARSTRTGKPLSKRLGEHAKSIEQADNLDLADFTCRWLIIDPVWIGLTEQVLISDYRPVWNAVVDGFGHHDQGSSRQGQKRSRWDTVHRGRLWAERQKNNPDSVSVILDAIRAHRAKWRRA